MKWDTDKKLFHYTILNYMADCKSKHYQAKLNITRKLLSTKHRFYSLGNWIVCGNLKIFESLSASNDKIFKNERNQQLFWKQTWWKNYLNAKCFFVCVFVLFRNLTTMETELWNFRFGFCFLFLDMKW